MGQLGADGSITIGLLEEADDLGKRLLGLILAGDVLERDAGLLSGDDLGAGLAHAVHSAHAAHTAEGHRGTVVAHGLFELTVEEPAAQEQQENRQHVSEQHVDEQEVVAS